MSDYKKGDLVYVDFPGGRQKGLIREVLSNYGFSDNKETKYQIKGVEGFCFTTITSSRACSKDSDK